MNIRRWWIIQWLNWAIDYKLLRVPFLKVFPFVLDWETNDDLYDPSGPNLMLQGVSNDGIIGMNGDKLHETTWIWRYTNRSEKRRQEKLEKNQFNSKQQLLKEKVEYLREPLRKAVIKAQCQ